MYRWLQTFPLRVRTLLHKHSVEAELREEMAFHLQAHMEELMNRGYDKQEAEELAMKAIKLEREMEQCREQRAWQGWERLKADIVFGWRQLKKRKVTTAAAVLSLGLAIGSCVGAFRLIDALLLRPLPIVHPERLHLLARLGQDMDGKPSHDDAWAYPDFALMRAASRPEADLIAVSYAERRDMTYASDAETEKGQVQYVSGWMFDDFGLQPALGRLFHEDDDRVPGAHPYAVLSYNYWVRRFGADPHVIGRSLRMDDQIFEVIGVGPKSFTGTETGTETEIFLPTMMHPNVTRDDASWHRTLAFIQPGTAMEPLRAKLDAVTRQFEAERSKGFVGMPANFMAMFLNRQLEISPATSGVSLMQEDYRHALTWLGVLVALVLLIACMNVANLMTALSASRAREMALRVSIGAGRLRLVQMVMVESTMLALMAGVLGTAFAWWSAPMVVRLINPASNPARLTLSVDWRVLAFGLLLILAVALLFGLAPALRASGVQPVHALKGGEAPQTKRQSMHALIAMQVAFCFVVLFLAGLFATSFKRLSNQPLGFQPQGVLLLDTIAPHGQPLAAWARVADSLRAMPGVQDVAESGWALMSPDGGWNGSISAEGGPPSQDWGYFLRTSPGWLGTMKMQLVEGRDFVADDSYPGNAIINQAFAREFFKGEDPLGKTFEKVDSSAPHQLSRVVGVVADAPYRNVHEQILPVAFVPLRNLNAATQKVGSATFVLRTSAKDPMVLADTMRRQVAQAGSGFRVSNVSTQAEIVENQTIRERLLAALGGFFAAVALLLAAIGLYGVLHYSVVQREKEIGIRIALGAATTNIARVVTARIMAMVCVGTCIGLVAGLLSVRFVESLLFGVHGTDISMAVFPGVILLGAVSLAAVPAVLRAMRTDPVQMLRAE